MLEVIARRVAIAAPLLVLISLINFALISVAPGDPLVMIVAGESGSIPPAQLEDLRRNLGLDNPWPVRYLVWLRGIVTGNWGVSLLSSQPVTEIVLSALWPTLLLMSTAMLLALVIGVAAGVASALRHNTWFDYLVTVVAFAGVSVPSFFLALGALYLFYSRLGWFPAAGMRTAATPFALGDVLYHLVMPAFVLAASHMATYARYTRSALLDVLHEEYIVTARAKGLRQRVVVWRHGLRNALVPLVTVVGLQLPGLFGGSVFVETVFSWPGIGSLAVEATFRRDYPVMMAIILMASVMVVVANLITDIAYGLVDPRIRVR